ncbi:unnamed protein product, partial [Porites lobata]
CGLRGGYIELVRFNDQLRSRVKTYLSARSCPSTIGQEVTSIKNSYRKKAKMTREVLNSMENVKCNEVAGAMYAFPRITLPKKAIGAAKAKEMPPDEFYCWQALGKTGIYMIPGHVWDMNGSGNNCYYRITILPSEETFAPMFERLRTFRQ